MSTEDQVEQLLKLLWGAPEPGRRGPKPRMSVAQIVAAGVTIADRDGLDAVSMQRVAGEVGRTTMSVYTYVPNKDILLDLMMDAAVGPAPDLVGDTWRDRVEDWVVHVSGLFRRRPWVLLVSVHSPPMGPNQLAWFDRLVGAVSESGMEPAETFAVAQYLLGAVREWSRLYNAQADQPETDYAKALEKLADPERFPALSRLVADGGVTHADPLMVGLQRLLDGVEARLERTRRG
jgi:AcrR family transcriptional regulator